MPSPVVEVESAARLMLGRAGNFHRDPPHGMVLRTEVSLGFLADHLVASLAARGVQAINLGRNQKGKYVVCLAGQHVEVDEAYEALLKASPPPARLRLVKPI